MRRFTLLAVVGALAALLVTACTAGPSVRPAVIAVNAAPGGSSPQTTPRPAQPRPNGTRQPLPPLATPQVSSIDWSDCNAQTRKRLGAPEPPADLRFRCGRVFSITRSQSSPVPIATHLSLLAVGTGKTPLVVIDDAGGEPGTLYAARLATVLPPDFLRKFMIVGMDRRGTGASQGLHCVPQSVRAEILGYRPDATDLSGLLDAERRATQQCMLELDNTRQSYTTKQNADDLELLRHALGVPRLNAIGRGEAGRVLATYATSHPAQTGRLVLDGTIDPSTDPEQRAEDQADSAKRAFDAFAAYCVKHHCPLGADPRTTVTDLLGALRDHPLSDDATGTEVTAGIAMNAILRALPERRLWPALADALAKAASGDGSGLATLVRPLLEGSSGDASRFDAGLVNNCNDQQQRLPPQRVVAASKAWQSKDSLFGGYFAQLLSRCTPWPVPSSKPPKPTAGAAPPLLVLSTANDPVTPAKGTEHAAAQLPTAVLVKWQGSGHGALTNSPCAAKAATAFLASGTIPTNGTVCPP